jgi:hypothetical protein
MHRSRMYLYSPASSARARIVGDNISRLALRLSECDPVATSSDDKHQRSQARKKKCRWLPNLAEEDGGLTPGYDDDDALLRVRRGPAVITERR